MKINPLVKAKEFLQNTSDSQLSQLVYTKLLLPNIPKKHIIRELANYAYQNIQMPLVLAIDELYPLIAQETFKRYMHEKQINQEITQQNFKQLK